jgi:hypothetical protein
MLMHPGGNLGVAISVLANVSLAVWATLEIGAGVNPFRRIVGGVVLVGLIVSLLVRLW